MRIAFFTDTYEPQINGVVTSIKVLEKQLRKSGHEVHVFFPAGKKTSKKKFIHAIKSVEFWPYPEYRMTIPSSEIVSKLRKMRPDVIHIQTPMLAGLLGLAAARILKKPVIATYPTLLTAYYGYVFGRLPKKISKKIVIKYTKWFYNKVDAVIVPTNPIKKLLESYGIEKKIIVLPNGLETGNYRKVRNLGKIPMLVHVGRLCKEKQIDIVIRAVGKVLAKEECTLVITSDGPDRRRLESLVKSLGLEGKVSFTGYIPDSAIKALFKKADALVYASQTETQGIVVMESMMFGCPVIVPKSLGFKDAVKNNFNGFAYRPVNEETLAKRILALIRNDRLRRKFIRNSYRMLKVFDAKNITNKLLAVYKGLSN
ncbi:MAG: glycosyltransferase [Candidatus Aenigmatarchaeota archaeon]